MRKSPPLSQQLKRVAINFMTSLLYPVYTPLWRHVVRDPENCSFSFSMPNLTPFHFLSFHSGCPLCNRMSWTLIFFSSCDEGHKDAASLTGMGCEESCKNQMKLLLSTIILARLASLPETDPCFGNCIYDQLYPPIKETEFTLLWDGWSRDFAVFRWLGGRETDVRSPVLKLCIRIIKGLFKVLFPANQTRGYDLQILKIKSQCMAF